MYISNLSKMLYSEIAIECDIQMKEYFQENDISG